MDSLNEVIEFEADAQEDRPRAMPLEVAAGTGNDGLRCKNLNAAFTEVDDRLLPLLHILTAINTDSLRQSFLDGCPFRFQVMPDDEMWLLKSQFGN